MMIRIHNWLLLREWLWSKKYVVLKKPKLKDVRDGLQERWEWEHYVLGYKTSSNFDRTTTEVARYFMRKPKKK